jgi:hypothetical protein
MLPVQRISMIPLAKTTEAKQQKHKFVKFRPAYMKDPSLQGHAMLDPFQK